MPQIAIDAQIGLQSVQSQAQSSSATKLEVELKLAEAQYDEAEKQNMEFKKAFDAKTQEFVSTTTRIQELTATKLDTEPKVELATTAAKLSVETLVAFGVKLEIVKQAEGSIKNELDRLQMELARFEGLPLEIATKKSSLEHLVATSIAQVEVAQAAANVSKLQIEDASNRIAKLEQQLEAIRSTIADEQTIRNSIQAELAAKGQVTNGLRGQIQQNEGELSNVLMQQQLIEKAYGKR